ncbi:MAG TPA: ABC transporter substrate-binding protein [Gammaproteobacteria bacterium]|nr:ABC transporter substrate-binding protein [Gammaproteobacteria bacterium]
MHRLRAAVLLMAVVIPGYRLAIPLARAADVVVTEYKADPSGAPFAVALEKGFFKKAGAGITGVVSGSGGGTSVRDVIASDLGYGEVTASAAIAAIAHGQDIKIVDIGSQTLADISAIVRPDSPLRSLRDLAGKKWGITNPKSLGEMIAVLSVEKAGLKPDQVKRIALGSMGGELTALEHGLVDVAAVPIMLLHMQSAASYRILARSDDLPALPPGVGVATGELIRKNPERLRAILAARRQAVQYLYAHPDQSAELLSPVYAPLSTDNIRSLLHEMVEAKFWSEGRIDMQLLENAERAMRYVGMLDSKVDLNSMINASFLPQDLQGKEPAR